MYLFAVPLPETQALCDDQTPPPLSVRRYFCNRERGLSGIVYSIMPSESISLILNLSLPNSECCPMATASSALLNSPADKFDSILFSTEVCLVNK